MKYSTNLIRRKNIFAAIFSTRISERQIMQRGDYFVVAENLRQGSLALLSLLSVSDRSWK